MAASQPASDRLTPPYAPWSTFVGFLDRLKSKGVPPKIDASVMDGMAGGTQSTLRSGMRFFGLIDQDANVQPVLKQWVAARGMDPEWSDLLRNCVKEAYEPVIQDLDLEQDTLAMLEAKFRANDVEGQVLEKAVRFYLSALKEANVPVSPYIDPSRSGGNGQRRTRAGARRRVVRRDQSETGVQPQPPAPSAGSIAVPEGFTVYQYRLRKEMPVQIALPDDLTDADVTRLHNWLKTLPIQEDQA